MYLYEKGFPPLGNIHSGNVFVVGEVCRLGGYENTLLGYKSRLHKLYKDHALKDEEHIDVLMFGEEEEGEALVTVTGASAFHCRPPAV